MQKSKLKIAVLGSRGIPNNYGGFEAFAQAFAVDMANRGHQITVYTSADHPNKEEYWKGIRRVLLANPEKRWGSFGQFLYDLYANWHSRKQRFDLVLHLGYTSDAIWWWLWPSKAKHLVNMDGMEWLRPKYSRLVRAFLLKGEKWATVRSDGLIADNKAVEQYLTAKYQKPVHYISYGAEIPTSYNEGIVKEYGLATHNYDLIIARMEPDNNIEMAIEARQPNDPVPLVIIGNDNAYRCKLMEEHGSKAGVLFLNAIYDQRIIDSLRHFSRIYIHGHSVGGTNPSLLEAMACGCLITAHDNVFNRAVLGDEASYFSSSESLGSMLKNATVSFREEWRNKNLSKIENNHQWSTIVDQYESLFYETL